MHPYKSTPRCVIKGARRARISASGDALITWQCRTCHVPEADNTVVLTRIT